MLWLLVYKVLPQNADANMQTVWDDILELYKAHKVESQYTSLTTSSFTTDNKPTKDYPRLKGRGAEVKGLVSIMVVIWDKHRRRRGANAVHDRRVLEILQRQDAIKSLVDDYKYDAFMPVEKSDELRVCIDRFLVLWTDLGHAADERMDLLFTSAPKLHWLWHFGVRSRYLSPRRGACLLDEDFVKYMKTIGQRCTAGTQLHNVPKLMMTKYRWLEMIESTSVS